MNEGPIRSSNRISAWVMWAFTLIWCAVSAPLLWQIASRWGTSAEGLGPLLLALVFPAIGVILIAVSTFATWGLFRFGAAPLWPDPSPGSIGGQVGGHIDIHHAFDANTVFTVQLSCLHSRMSGSGKNRSRSESVVWQTDGVCQVERTAGTVRLRFTFDVPPDLPASDPIKSDSYYLWRLGIAANIDGPDFRRSYEIPVTDGPARQATHAAATDSNAQTFDAALAGIESVAQIHPAGNGIEAYFGAFRRPAAGAMQTIVGLPFAGIGAVALGTSGPIMAGAIFLVLGSIFACAGIFSLGKSLLVSVSPKGLRTRRFFFGYPLRTRKLQAAEITSVRIKQAGSMRWGQRNTVFYTLEALGSNDSKLTVAERLESRSEAELLRESFLTYLDRSIEG